MTAIRIPGGLVAAVDEDGDPARREWLALLPDVIDEIASTWALHLGEPYEPGGQCAWVAPAHTAPGDAVVLKVGWRHSEAEHEVDALLLWNGDGAVRCLAARTFDQTSALLLERCVPGTALNRHTAEPEQDVVVAGLLRRLWRHRPPAGHPFRPLETMCDEWADEFESDFETDSRGLDRGLARAGIEILRELPGTAERTVLLSTDLHAGNILASQREQWLAIDPKPYVGDPAYDAVQHMLNCDARLAADPAGLASRMAQLLELEPERVRLWLFARCAQEAVRDPTMRGPARRLALAT